MGRMAGIKWEKAMQCRPVHNIISSDFPKYNPQPWKFMPGMKTLHVPEDILSEIKVKRVAGMMNVYRDGKARIQWLLSYEYHRMWLEEREAWKKRMYPENTTVNVDVVKRYVLTFKNDHQPPKPEQKKPFKMKKFTGIPSKTATKRAPDDKAMAFEKDVAKK